MRMTAHDRTRSSSPPSPLLLAACARPRRRARSSPAAPGFLLGVWHGFIFPVAWIVSLVHRRRRGLRRAQQRRLVRFRLFPRHRLLRRRRPQDPRRLRDRVIGMIARPIARAGAIDWSSPHPRPCEHAPAASPSGESAAWPPRFAVLVAGWPIGSRLPACDARRARTRSASRAAGVTRRCAMCRDRRVVALCAAHRLDRGSASCCRGGRADHAGSSDGRDSPCDSGCRSNPLLAPASPLVRVGCRHRSSSPPRHAPFVATRSSGE